MRKRKTVSKKVAHSAVATNLVSLNDRFEVEKILFSEARRRWGGTKFSLTEQFFSSVYFKGLQ